jgi:hypothetical protein
MIIKPEGDVIQAAGAKLAKVGEARRMVLKAFIFIVFGTVIGTVCPPPLIAQDVPLDTVTAQRLLQQVTAALDSTPSLSRRPGFIEHLAWARGAWGMSVIPLWPHLARIGRLRAELAAHLKRGEIYPAMAKADSVGSQETYQVLAYANDPPDSTYENFRSLVAQIHQYLAEHPKTLEAHGFRTAAKRMRAHYEFAAVMAANDTVRDSSDRIAWNVELAVIAMQRGFLLRDSLLLATRRQVRGYQGYDDVRGRWLDRLAYYCIAARMKNCETPRTADAHATNLRAQNVYAAISLGEWAAAEAYIDSLEQYLPPARVGAILMKVPLETRWQCVGVNLKCGPELDRRITLWLNQSDRWLRDARDAALRDTLLASAAILWAGRQTPRSFEMLNRVRDPALRARAFSDVAKTIRDFAPQDSWRAFLQADTTARMLASGFAADFRAKGDTANERRALQRLNTIDRMVHEFQWAWRLANNGQWIRARNHALAALEMWDPVAEPMISWAGQFDVLKILGIYPQLINWAATRPDVTARTAAILAVVTALPPPMPKRPQ